MNGNIQPFTNAITAARIELDAARATAATSLAAKRKADAGLDAAEAAGMNKRLLASLESVAAKHHVAWMDAMSDISRLEDDIKQYTSWLHGALNILPWQMAA